MPQAVKTKKKGRQHRLPTLLFVPPPNSRLQDSGGDATATAAGEQRGRGYPETDAESWHRRDSDAGRPNIVVFSQEGPVFTDHTEPEIHSCTALLE